jgi:hypothetical protein
VKKTTFCLSLIEVLQGNGQHDGLVIALRPQNPKKLGAAGYIILTPANQLMEE